MNEIKEHKASEADIAALLERISETQARENASRATADTATAVLHRLIRIARSDTGQSMTCRQLLMSLYNGRAWPFNTTELRGLDYDLLDDALTIIRADASMAWPDEVHVITGEQELFERWRQEFVAEKETNR
ncbi:MAG: hypothetical protein JAY75_23025 [Candidatus Thiodiazotropha taylori]|nr:hypothetical protein [Candidatus Thiodiazotropha taylori]MCG8095376.1 hypothetical protein [Candidatus Thiodiazotropha endolucinida]MCG7882930.1 hypothetical protein [Candidatus Thiodiazotropha taylori]MCG7888550.1 hypothetical protein [Candidatus Thiodiazotropha taylori]MCG7892256.1 hypothetical protein [Candidatus Thiodiazotropha taylori]